MVMDLDLEIEYYNRLNERFTPAELVDILDVSVEDIWNAFYERILESRLLQDMVGMNKEDE